MISYFLFNAQCNTERIQELENLLATINNTNQQLSNNLSLAMAAIAEFMEQFNSSDPSMLVYSDSLILFIYDFLVIIDVLLHIYMQIVK